MERLGGGQLPLAPVPWGEEIEGGGQCTVLRVAPPPRTKCPTVQRPVTALAPSHSHAPTLLAPPRTRLCHPSQKPRVAWSLGLVPSPVGPSCCPTSAQHGLGGPWSAFWARSCPHSQPLSLLLPSPHLLPLPWLAGARVPPCTAPPGALLPGSPPSSSFPHWEHLDLRTSVPGEMPAFLAFLISLLASRTFFGLHSQRSNQCSLLSLPHVPALPFQPQLAIPFRFDHCSSPVSWLCYPPSPFACSVRALHPPPGADEHYSTPRIVDGIEDSSHTAEAPTFRFSKRPEPTRTRSQAPPSGKEPQ